MQVDKTSSSFHSRAIVCALHLLHFSYIRPHRGANRDSQIAQAAQGREKNRRAEATLLSCNLFTTKVIPQWRGIENRMLNACTIPALSRQMSCMSLRSALQQEPRA